MPQQVEQLFSNATDTLTNLTNPNPTPKPHEITTSITTPQNYENSGPYSSLSEELQEFTHSRINADLKPGYDIMEIMLETLQWNEQDVEQMWMRPVGHVDQPSYDHSTASGLDISIQDVLRKVQSPCTRQHACSLCTMEAIVRGRCRAVGGSSITGMGGTTWGSQA